MGEEIGSRLRGGRQLRAVAPRRLTPKALEAFLGHLAGTCNVRLSARKANIDRSLLYKRREVDPAFDAAWKRAVLGAYELLEMAALERGIHGVRKAVFHAGKRVGTTIEYDPRTALQLLKMHRESVAGAAAGQWSAEDDARQMDELEARFALMRERLLADEEEEGDSEDGAPEPEA